jgi:hypothetical protein
LHDQITKFLIRRIPAFLKNLSLLARHFALIVAWVAAEVISFEVRERLGKVCVPSHSQEC